MSGSLVISPVTLLKSSVRNRCSFLLPSGLVPEADFCSMMKVCSFSMLGLGLWSQICQKTEAVGPLRNLPEVWRYSSAGRVFISFA